MDEAAMEDITGAQGVDDGDRWGRLGSAATVGGAPTQRVAPVGAGHPSRAERQEVVELGTLWGGEVGRHDGEVGEGEESLEAGFPGPAVEDDRYAVRAPRRGDLQSQR